MNKQKYAANFSFINFFNSAQHVSGNKFAHPQEHFLTVCTAFGTMHRSAAVSVHCTKSCTYSPKSALEDGRNCRPKHVGLNEKINKRISCCILLVIYIVVLK